MHFGEDTRRPPSQNKPRGIGAEAGGAREGDTRKWQGEMKDYADSIIGKD